MANGAQDGADDGGVIRLLARALPDVINQYGERIPPVTSASGGGHRLLACRRVQRLLALHAIIFAGISRGLSRL